MSHEETKKLIYEELLTIAEDILLLENIPSKLRARIIIGHLYEVMRQLSDFSEGNGY